MRCKKKVRITPTGKVTVKKRRKQLQVWSNCAAVAHVECQCTVTSRTKVLISSGPSTTVSFCTHVHRHVYRHVQIHVQRHMYGCMYRHVPRHVCRHVYGHVLLCMHRLGGCEMYGHKHAVRCEGMLVRAHIMPQIYAHTCIDIYPHIYTDR